MLQGKVVLGLTKHHAVKIYALPN